MYAAERPGAHSSSKRRGGFSKSTNLMKEMSGFQSENLSDSLADEEYRRGSNCSSTHVCKYCSREFSSGRALGGHMRAHGSLTFDSNFAAASWNTNHHHAAGGIAEKLEQLSSSGRHGDARPSLEYDPADDNSDHAVTVSNSNFRGLSYRIKLDSSSGSLCRIYRKESGRKSRNSDDPEAEADVDDDDVDDDDVEEEVEEDEYEEDASVKASATSAHHSNFLDLSGDGADAHEIEFDNANAFGLHMSKDHGPLYTLRRNPKPSKRFVDRVQYAVDTAQASAFAPPSKKSNSSNLINDQAHACTECGKEFLSWKALFGHMRCHPEREWRGIQRPISQDQEKLVNSSVCKKKAPPSPCEESEYESSKAIKQAISDDNSDAESIEAAYMNVEDKIGLQSWMTGKRSKRSRQVVRSLQKVTDNAPEFGSFNANSNEIKEDTDMANCLVMLACASRSPKELTPSNKMRRTASISSTDFDRRSDSGHDIVHKQRSLSSDQGGRAQRHWHSKDQSRLKLVKVYADDSSLCEGMNEVGGGRDQQATADLQTVKAKYECATCKRIFKSHQALGGHRASHKKVKGCFARTHASDGGDSPGSPEEEITDEDMPIRYSDEERPPAIGRKHAYGHLTHVEDVKETTSHGIKRPGLSKKMKGHECSICHRVFPSGQALGGHKRCHWGGAGSSEASIVPVSSSSHVQQQAPVVSHGFQRRTGREELQLDLNLPAPEEEYENFYVNYRVSSSDPQVNQLATRSMSDESNAITVPKSPGEFISSAYDARQKVTSSGNCRGEQFLYPQLKLVAAQETGSSKEYVAAQESELEGSADRELLNCRYLERNICDQDFTSVEALDSHQKTHTSVMSSVSGLTPISA
ncbi:hypothetical protein O6H91_15G057800 [Diphasiastrum complanatum]|uniref:Uncharacterized protein n=1 Tax=Diphasiastrum complanatum TaxID=34168 RepID=A0ACC2BIL3_DIPCM|nr:hypothetical protein O6H91_15G057800 [Diphasiastrum complanatum]